MKNETIINMSGSIFSDVKRDMTMTLQAALAKMEEVGSDKATVTTKIVIELKSEIEKIREQIQNIE